MAFRDMFHGYNVANVTRCSICGCKCNPKRYDVELVAHKYYFNGKQKTTYHCFHRSCYEASLEGRYF